MAVPASVVIALCSHVIAESVQMHIQSASATDNDVRVALRTNAQRQSLSSE
jgi:hypothetical protein